MANIFKTCVVGPLATNCYIFADGADCFVIDPGFPSEQVIKTIRDLLPSGKVSVLLTHSHGDHFMGSDQIVSQFPGTAIYISEADKPGLYDPRLNVTALFGMPFVLENKDAVKTVADGDQLNCGTIQVEVLATPGHTVGGVSYAIRDKKLVFGGDCLFAGSVGRTDFPGGNWTQLMTSIKEKIFTLGDDFRVLPGHGDATTVAAEKTA
jgi:glyoxylase-like metal-dependent hydrolase (beta-lactamase superfamily II)